LGIGHGAWGMEAGEAGEMMECGGIGKCFLGQVFLIRQIFGILKPKSLSENLKLRSIIENILNYLSKA
jgi:hypothetical protein